MITGEERELAEEIRAIALTAGAKILSIYASDFEIEEKADASPVTEADQAAEEIILAELARLTPEIPVVAEESVAAGNIPDISGGAFWLVDPLDGTREFINRNGEFTVNIALIRAGLPALGVVYAPAKSRCYWSAGAGDCRMKEVDNEVRTIAVRPVPPEGMTAVVSRSHKSPETDELLARYNVAKSLDAGSSLKLCLLAEGAADFYPRLGRTMEWDIAAGHAVLIGAGGHLETLEGGAFTYGKPGFENPHFLAFGAR